jgi:hypothetical protein
MKAVHEAVDQQILHGGCAIAGGSIDQARKEMLWNEILQGDEQSRSQAR